MIDHHLDWHTESGMVPFVSLVNMVNLKPLLRMVTLAGLVDLPPAKAAIWA
jgi:hypothetical protein